MRQFLLTVAITFAAALPVHASDLDEESCAATTEIVSAAMFARKLGQTPEAAKTDLTNSGAVDAQFVPLIGPMVDWVFTLQDNQLNDRFLAQFRDECLKYKAE